ncbi:MAG: TRAP transporter fused permease subunit, partial [Alphaproteobacteria bacterium]|nr:TRAP transporter fused permease subunit [Alphaproteobacteria bacterium]
CNSLFGWARGGPAKAAVASGVLFGAISGSAVANVVASGMVTIPMMRKVGYDRSTAAAIEATSSTGGQITPPVLGAGAFLMAEITGIAYADIAFASLIPCALFYVACLAHVDFHARLAGMRGLPGSELPAVRPLVLKLYLFAPLVMLVWALLAGYSTFRAGSLGIITALVVVWVAFYLRLVIGRGRSAAAAALATDRILLVLVGAVVLFLVVEGAAPEAVTAATTWLPSLGYDGVWALVGIIVLGLLASGEHRRLIFDGLETGARDSIQLICVCGSAGIIVGVIALTGLGGRFADVILAIAGESKLLAMVFTMVITLILGMGMPTTAAYAIAAAVVAPGLIRIGVPALVAHMFIFYFAVLSAITPPVALASFAAAAMAKADPWKTSFIAGKMGFATFLVPFMFFYNAALLGQGSFLDILQPVATACAGVVLLAAATEGWLFGRLPALWRVVIGIAALLLIHPGSATDLAGVVLAAVGIAGATFQRRKLGTAA